MAGNPESDMNSSKPDVSVIIPVYNAESYISMCLHALKASSYSPFETIVIDDGSTDGSVAAAEGFGVRVLKLSGNSGPAVARNEGAAIASGEILLFIDADVLVRGDTVSRVAHTLKENPQISAVFGSYDDSPSAPDFLSQYRNLLHHFVHQKSRSDASSFWSGCGAIRKSVFIEMGGFDRERFSKPSIEDIDLGYRMRRKGHAILLDKDLQVKHLKRWGLISIIKTDVWDRAIPWSKLIIESKRSPRDLNLKTSDRMSTALVGILFLCLLVIVLWLFGAVGQKTVLIAAVLAILNISALLVINRELYMFFLENRGPAFTLLAVPMHFLYYLYSGVSFGLCWIGSKMR